MKHKKKTALNPIINPAYGKRKELVQSAAAFICSLSPFWSILDT
jgi:hypothetical protein